MTRLCSAAVIAALDEYDRYLGPEVNREKAMRFAVLAAVAEQERQEAQERAHAGRRDNPLRLADLALTVERVQRRRRTAADDVL